ncbi:transcription repressor NadR [Salsuginibacillus kocurii]|uniref:transcription repressor NadR n=1 Tax=Salsuginibacillus kocurii TaxID=427078 RepID=UPI000374B6A9|nr:transcription repressor NadR [Salsuginibacillus kocurii]
MNTKTDKMRGEKRRTFIKEWLENSEAPLTGKELAEATNVSRQVVVQDISILKARDLPILATSQGYVFMRQEKEEEKKKRVFACQHGKEPSTTEKELTLMVSEGATVKNVMIEHPLYGDLTASLMLSSVEEVQTFISRLKVTRASLLSELTDGVHLHTVEAASEDTLDRVEKKLQEHGFLL